MRNAILSDFHRYTQHTDLRHQRRTGTRNSKCHSRPLELRHHWRTKNPGIHIRKNQDLGFYFLGKQSIHTHNLQPLERHRTTLCFLDKCTDIERCDTDYSDYHLLSRDVGHIRELNLQGTLPSLTGTNTNSDREQASFAQQGCRTTFHNQTS